MKAIVFSLLIITSISFITPLVYAESDYTGRAYDACTSRPGSETLTREELDECILETEQYLELNELRGESRNTETYNRQFLALGGTIAVCAIIGILVLKFVILKKNR